MKLLDMSEDEIRQLGEDIGKIALMRPDVTHCILVGIRDGLEKTGFNIYGFGTYGFGDALWSLWRHGHYNVSDPQVNLQIPFSQTSHISGQGSSCT